MLVEYLRVLEAAFDSMVDDLVAARMDSVHGCAANRRELLHTAPSLTFISSSASHSPTILATARRLPTTEEFNQAIAPAPSTRRSTTLMEPISEEEVESPASLRLTLGRPREILTISD